MRYLKLMCLVLMMVLAASGEPQSVTRLQECSSLQAEPMYYFASLPDSVWVNNKAWKIKKVPGAIKLAGDERDYMGMTYCPSLLSPTWKKMFTIEVDTKRNKPDVKETLIHELLHATSMCDDTSLMTRHRFIEDTAQQLRSVLSDPRNKPFFDYLEQ